MLRVFYFSGFRMTVFDWNGNHLLNSVEFQPDEEGLENFEYLLKNSVPMPAKLLVDMIEEDFRRETIPHVNIFDRKVLVKRLMDRHYRAEDYVHSQSIGRTKLGRKDDQVLLSALTNTGLLAPWIERIEKYSVRLAGIWSVPLLTQSLLKKVANNEEHTLIVSRQVPGAMRDSYFQNGKLILSRQAKFDRDTLNKEDFDGVMSNLARGALEIYNFLINQRVLEAGVPLHVYCLLPTDQIVLAEASKNKDERIIYNFVDLDVLFKTYSFRNDKRFGADVLFSLMCARANPFVDHYCNKERKSTYYSYVIDRFVKQIAEVGSLVCITIAVFLALKSLEINMEVDQLLADTAEIETKFNDEYGSITRQLETAKNIQQAVEWIDIIKDDVHSSPQDFFPNISQVLTKPAYEKIHLDNIQWEKLSKAEADILITNYRIALDLERDDAQFQESENPSSEGTIVPKQPILRLVGSFDLSGSSYRKVATTMKSLVVDFEAVVGVKEVLLIRTPVDVRESGRFTDQINNRKEETAPNSSEVNRFELILVLVEAQNA